MFRIKAESDKQPQEYRKTIKTLTYSFWNYWYDRENYFTDRKLLISLKTHRITQYEPNLCPPS